MTTVASTRPRELINGDDSGEGSPGYAGVMAEQERLIQRPIREIDVSRARALLAEKDPPLLVDVRRQNEWDAGRLPGALHVPLDELGQRIEESAPDRERPVLLYCATGNRSLRGARAMVELGYADVASVAGGIEDWRENGYPVELPAGLDRGQFARYSRHLLIPEVGAEGQRRLLDARILLIGAGGLGSPAALYLAAAGVGTLGIVDDDAVDETNLQRQVLHSTAALGEPKTESGARRLRELNPDVDVVPYRERLSAENIDRILDQGWDVVVDGADNFPTRYLVNDASVWHDVPVVHGSIYRFEGQVTVFDPGTGPCYRCLFPQPPPPELAPSCAEGGVLGVLPGVIGSMQASEALKLVLGAGEPLVGRLLLFDALAASFTEVAVRRDPDCPVCGESPTITEYVDYVEFCQGGPAHSAA
jgi:sulfur-carrier protein adenylyltransferase/sulfurtransferase